MSNIDYLTEDKFIPLDQKFVCISFLTDKDNKTTLSGIKIRGVFPTYELACEHAKKVQSIDPYFNVFVGDTGKWLPFDPNPDSEVVKDSEYANEQLNDLMKGYLENQEQAKVFHEQRKTELIRQNILDNLASKQNDITDIKNKLNDNKDEDLINKLKIFEEQYEKMNNKKEELNIELEKINKNIQNFDKNFKPPKIITTNN